MGKFTFNGKSSESLGLVIQTPPTYTFPDRDMTSSHVPGRNGDLYIDNNCYKNVERAYSLAKGYAAGSSYVDNAEEILSWLTSAKGKYVKLTDTYDPLVYRLALFNMSGSFTDIWNGALTIPVSFICKPQRFLISGDTPVTTSGATAEIENEYGYPSKPIISVSGLSSIISSPDDLLMLSVYDNNDNIVSNVSITKPAGDASMYNVLQIDSETETTVDGNGKDVSSTIGLNGNSFPYLDNGDNTVEIKKYEIDIYSSTSEISGHNIPSYNYLISLALSDNDGIITSSYLPQSTLIDAKQTKIKIRSYEALIASLQERYAASSVQAMAGEQAKTYTFESFNNLLNQYGQSFTFTGTKDDNPSWPDWLSPSGTGSTYSIKVPDDDSLVDEKYKRGFYLVKNRDKKLIYKSAGESIIENVNASSITTIYFYPAKLNINYIIDSTVINEQTFNTAKEDHGLYIKQENYFVDSDVIDSETFSASVQKHGHLYKFNDGSYEEISTYSSSVLEYYYLEISYTRVYAYLEEISVYYKVSTVTESHQLDIGYTNIPDWLDFSIDYESTESHSPKSISFKTKAIGYYWTDKDWIFGKAKWTKYGSTEIGTVLNSLSWSTSKLAFVSTSGLITSTTTEFTYKYIENVPVYEDITAVTTDENGNRVTTVLAKARFVVNDISSLPKDFSKITLTTIDAGYYGYQKNGDGEINWIWKNAGDQIASIAGTDSFDIYYLESEPSYANEQDWPSDILNPIPIKRPTGSFKPDYISFRTVKAGKYRYSLNEDGSVWSSSWQDRLIGEEIVFSPSETKDYQDQFFIARVDAVPDKLDFDRGYVDADGNISEDPPLWLTVKCYKDKNLQVELTAAEYDLLTEEEKNNVVFRYSTGAVLESDYAYYKWDNSDAWVCKNGADQDLLISGNVENTVFNYLYRLPEYDEYTHFSVDHEEDSNGNPELITFTAKTRGYYRPNNSSDWKDYKVGQIILQSKVNENNTLRYLSPTEDSLANLAITIIPRWWML